MLYNSKGKINAALVPKAHSLNTVQHYSLFPSFRALFLSSWIQLEKFRCKGCFFSYKNSSTTSDDQECFCWNYEAAACNVQWSPAHPKQSRTSEINRCSYLGRVRLRIRQFREISGTRYWRRQQRVKDDAAPQRPRVNEFLSSWRLL